MTKGKRHLLAAALVLGALAWPAAVPAQDLMNTALSSFPTGTIRVEYSSPAKLRALPDYAALSKRYVGPNLIALENDLAKLGIQQEDIDELVIGWQARGASMELSGVAQGRFDPKAVADRAAAQGLAATPVGGTSAYCLGAGVGGNCVVILNESLGAFGALDSLGAIMKARAGEAPNAASDTKFAKHVDDARTDAAIWGVAVGPAIADWFKGWMPNQGNVQLDWKATFQSVEVLSYSVQAADKVNLDVKLDCTTSSAAQSLTQVMQGLKLLQQMAWQNQNPRAPNPFKSLVVDRSDTQVRLNLTTEYSELEAGIPGNS
ncbi:MAG TPA: hypothetical protein VG028_02485 [Terriglobia bacterium]|nr:hypothetical protein [Terriglobia bacterium]